MIPAFARMRWGLRGDYKFQGFYFLLCSVQRVTTKGAGMKRIASGALGVFMFGLVGASNAGSGDVSQQIQMLNSQIQAQLQKMQADQQKLNQTFNAQVQAQLKQMQSQLQDQIKKASDQSTSQLKQVQAGLEQEIQQVHKAATAAPPK